MLATVHSVANRPHQGFIVTKFLSYWMSSHKIQLPKNSMLVDLNKYFGESSSFFWRNMLISFKSFQCAGDMATDPDAGCKFFCNPENLFKASYTFCYYYT